jgi:predicted PurR-regulated permease PerM
MEVNNKMKHTIKVAWAKGFSQFLALAGAILLVFVLFKFDAIMAQIVRIINILMPIIMGIVLAYLINPMVEFYDRKLSNSLGKAIEKKCGKRPSMRGLSILISLAIIIAIIVVLIMMAVIAMSRKALRWRRISGMNQRSPNGWFSSSSLC